MPEYLGGPGLRKIVREGTDKAAFKRVSVQGAGKVAVVTVHSVKPDSVTQRRNADLVPQLEKALRKSVTVEVQPEAQAIHKFVRVSPTKARRVMNEVRGKYVDEALAVLKFVPNRAARYVEKLIKSAAANAFEGWGADPSELKVGLLKADAGPTWKRIQPRAMGRAYRILKRTAHLTVAVQAAEPRAGSNTRRRGRSTVTRA
jgi:ribosomal protein L22